MTPTITTLHEVPVVPGRPGTEEAGFGALSTQRGGMPLREMTIEGRVVGLYFRTCLRQTFVNAFGTPLEATYVFPLPDRAAVSRFVLRVGGRVVEGELKERGQARRDYQVAIESGHRAALAEEDRPGVFTMTAGNIPAGESVSVELELGGPLTLGEGEATFRFPLVVAPRYIPGVALEGPSAGSGTASDTDAVPDASRITPPVLLPGQPSPVRLGISLEVDPAGLPIRELRTSLYSPRVEDRGGGKFRVELAPGTDRMDRDFLLRFRVGAEGLGSGLVFLPASGETDGTFALTVAPPDLVTAGVTPRDVVVVLDRSGSMSGWKMVAGRRAAGRLLDTLTDRDRFGVILFDDQVEVPTIDGKSGCLLPASDRNRFRAVEFLTAAEDRGGTEMARALDRALEFFDAESTSGRERIVVFVTDGQVGNEDQLLWQVRKQARGVRVFAIGVDQAVNEAFLKRLSQPTGGHYELVESESRLDEVMKNVYRRIGRPVLQDVEIELDGAILRTETLTPTGAGDVFPGVPSVLMGRFAGTPKGPARIRGLLPDGSRFLQKVEPVASSDELVTWSWARSRVLDLEHRYVSEGNRDAALASEITRVSLTHKVLCRFTAFVAVDRAEVVNEGGHQHKVTQPVEPAAGWDMLEEEKAAPKGRAKRAAKPMAFSLARGPHTGAPPPAAAPSPMRAAACAPPPPPTEAFEMLCDLGSDMDFASSEEADLGGLGSFQPEAQDLEAPGSGAGQGGLLGHAKDALSKLSEAMGGGKGRAAKRQQAKAEARKAAIAPGGPPPRPVPAPPRWKADFLARHGVAWRALLDEGVPAVRRATTSQDVQTDLAYLLADLEVLVEALEKEGAAMAGIAGRLREILATLQGLPSGSGPKEPALVAALTRLEEVDAEVQGKVPPTLPPQEPATRREFWK